MITFKKTPFIYEEEVAFFFPPEVYWPYSTSNFYISSYLCPECGDHMVKTVFPQDIVLQTEEGTVAVPRIFACGKCNTIHIPKPGYKLSRNNGYYVKLTVEEFKKTIYMFDTKGSVIGSQGTLYNER